VSEAHAIRVEHAREAKPNGWWGIALFVAGEATLFGTLIGSYFYLRFNTLQWPPPGVPEPKVALPLILTGVLVATSVPMYAAVNAGRNGRRARAWWLVALALLVQTGYFAMQVHLFADDLAKVDPQASSYGSIYATLVGADHAHVFVGLLLNLWLLVRLVTGLTSYRLVGLRVVAFYWYFVIAVSVAVGLTQISPSL
jgi:cytochrome c oxidase subunit 3/cytochrome c oxidase subunit I+III